MKKTRLVISGVLAVALSGCASMGYVGGSYIPGAVYTDARLPVQAGEGNGEKQGVACATSVLGWVAWGDASVEAAKKNGGITEVASVDVKVKSILGVHATYCTEVRGK